jgi:eukaryotic-like serine/threonine-protein kinase
LSGQPNPRERVFGPFTFDESSGRLTKRGVRLRLQGQPLHILSALIRQPGELVSRQALHQQLWNDSTFVDFDHSLNAAMNRLRSVLGDSADRPRYIETFPSRGYRFIAPVQEVDPKPVAVAPVTDSVAAPTPPGEIAEPGRKRYRRWAIATVSIAGAVIACAAGMRSLTRSVPQPLQFSISPPDGYALRPSSGRQSFALSPDGARIVFAAVDASGVFRTFIRDLDSPVSRPLANGEGSYNVSWAPDGLSVFLTVGGKLRRIGLRGESYQEVCDLPAISLAFALLGPNLMISARTGTFLVPVSGGTPRAMNESYPWPQVLPDGKHLLHTVSDKPSGRRRARVVSLGDPHTAKDLFESDSRTVYAPSSLRAGAGHLLSVRAGNLLAHPFDPVSLRVQSEPLPLVAKVYSHLASGGADFSASANGAIAYQRYKSRSQLAWVNRRGEVLRTIGPADVNLQHGVLSPDGTRIATTIFDVRRGANELWIIDAKTGGSRRIVEEGSADNPVWAPDSNRLVFARAFDYTPKLFVRGVRDQDTAEPLPPEYFQIPRDWSRDGRFIAWTNTSFAQTENEMRGEIWVIDMRRRKPIRLSGRSHHYGSPAFSPDGRWLAFTSNESGRTEVYIQGFAAGEAPRLIGGSRVVSNRGAICIRWRHDGKELFYLGWDGRVYGVPITLSPKLQAGEAVPLFTIGTEARAALHSSVGFDVSPDGQAFLIPLDSSLEKSEIIVIQNWESAQRQAPRK